MLRQYVPLAEFSLAPYASSTLAHPAPNPVTLDSPAVDVMTDLALVAAVTIEASASLVTANDYMIARGVRSLFVTAPNGRVTGVDYRGRLAGRTPGAREPRTWRRAQRAAGDGRDDAHPRRRGDEARGCPRRKGRAHRCIPYPGGTPARPRRGDPWAGRSLDPRDILRIADCAAIGCSSAHPGTCADVSPKSSRRCAESR